MWCEVGFLREFALYGRYLVFFRNPIAQFFGPTLSDIVDQAFDFSPGSCAAWLSELDAVRLCESYIVI